MIKLVVLITIYFTVPLLIIYLCKRWSFFKRLGSIVIAYAFGLILGSSGILPTGSENYYLALKDDISISKEKLDSLLASGTITDDLLAHQP